MSLRVANPKKVLVEQSPPQTHSGNLFIPQSAQVRPMDGTVVAIGSGIRDLEVNYKVLVGWQHGGTETFTMDGKDYWLLNEWQVLAILNP